LMNACRLGLGKCPEFGDWVLPFRFVRHPEIAALEADGAAIPARHNWPTKQQEQIEPGAQAVPVPDRDRSADSQASSEGGPIAIPDLDIYNASPGSDRAETGTAVDIPVRDFSLFDLESSVILANEFIEVLR
jgi:hypothetical protein